MINKTFFNELNKVIVDNFSRKFDFTVEINNYILFLRKDKIEIQIWNDCSATFFDLTMEDKKLGIFYLLYHKNESLAKKNVIAYQKKETVNEKIDFIFQIIESDFYELISLDYDKINSYFTYSNTDFLDYIHKVQNWVQIMKKKNIAVLLKTLTFSNIKKINGLMFYETSDGSIILNKGYMYIYIYIYIWVLCGK